MKNNKLIYILAPVVLVVILAVATVAGTKEADETVVAEAPDSIMAAEDYTLEDFIPQPDMRLEALLGMPGLTWELDSALGVCNPDTIELWAAYGGESYRTNVKFVRGEKAHHMTETGNEKLQARRTDDLRRTDFKPTAIIIETPHGSKLAFDAMRANSLALRLNDIQTAVANFFYSNGDMQYMDDVFAQRWSRILLTAEQTDEREPNPFNMGTEVKFRDGSVTVVVTNPSEGIAEVRVYNLDSQTPGSPGWTHWTVRVVRERGQYKLNDVPSYHTRFSNIDFQ